MLSDEIIASYLADFGEAAEAHAQAIHERTLTENMRPVIRAHLMRASGEKSAARAEVFALDHPDYLQAVTGVAAACEQEARARYTLEKHRLRIELLRTRESSRRAEMKHLGG